MPALSKADQLKHTKKTVKKAKSKRYYGKQLDTVFSLLVRLRDGKCLKCGKTEGLQCAHLASRKHLAGRWNEHNAITLCYSCHLFWAHKEPVEFSEWLKKTYPSLWEECQDVKNQRVKWSVEEYQLMLSQLQTRAKELARKA